MDMYIYLVGKYIGLYAALLLHRAAACKGYEDMACAVTAGIDRFMSEAKMMMEKMMMAYMMTIAKMMMTKMLTMKVTMTLLL